MAINCVAERLELDPLTANAIMLAVGGAIDGAQDGDILKGIADAYTNALINATSFGVARLDSETGEIQIAQQSSWQEAAYISRVLDITNSLNENGLEQTLYDYSASVLHFEAVNGFTRPGGVYDILGEHLSGLGDVAFEIIDKLNGVKEIKNTETGETLGRYKEDGDTKVLEMGGYETDPATGEEQLKDGRVTKTEGDITEVYDVADGKATKATFLDTKNGVIAIVEGVDGNPIDSDNYKVKGTTADSDSAYEKEIQNKKVVEGADKDLGETDSPEVRYKKDYKDNYGKEILEDGWEKQWREPPDDGDDSDAPPSNLETLLIRIWGQMHGPSSIGEIILPMV